MARASGTRFVFDAAALPALAGRARSGARPASRPAARPTTGASSLPQLTVDEGVAPELVTLAHDPQTSGGLLAAVPADRVAAVAADLAAAGVDHWVGSVGWKGTVALASSSAADRAPRDRRADPGLQRGAPDRAVVRGALEHLPVIVVDDGSSDDTADRAREAGATVIEQRPNAGKGAALRAGFRRALDDGLRRRS